MEIPRILIVGTGLERLEDTEPPFLVKADIIVIYRADPSSTQSELFQLDEQISKDPEIKTRLQEVLHTHNNAFALLGDVEAIDKGRKLIHLSKQVDVGYNHLIEAIGGNVDFSGNPDTDQFAKAVNHLLDAVRIRKNIVEPFSKSLEKANRPKLEKFPNFALVEQNPQLPPKEQPIDSLARDQMLTEFSALPTQPGIIFLFQI